MKKVLVIGKNSYIATSFCHYAHEKLEITTVSASDGEWEKIDFQGFDSVINFAGIAHRKETENNVNLYYKVNRDLALEIAKKAKISGVHLIFLSSMSVYGLTTGNITEKTVPCPINNYGKSKLEAELLISELSDENFNPSIIRPPMVYGLNCKGNFQTLLGFAISFPFFPDFQNRRSMIYIDNLCEFLYLVIENKTGGVLFPQDKEYVCTTDLLRIISEFSEKKLFLTKLFNSQIAFLCTKSSTFSKVFGDLTYSKSMSNTFGGAYQIYDTKTAICKSIRK